MRRHRTAMTLIEILVYMSLASLVMGTGVKLLLTISNLNRQLCSDLEASASAARLERQFRSDVHRSTTASQQAGDLRLEPADASQRIVYRAERTRLVRQVTRLNGTPLRHEVYHFEDPIGVDFVTDPPFVKLTLRRQRDAGLAENSDYRPVLVHVVAALKDIAGPSLEDPAP